MLRIFEIKKLLKLLLLLSWLLSVVVLFVVIDIMTGEGLNGRSFTFFSKKRRYSSWSINVVRQVEFTVLCFVLLICFIDCCMIWNYKSSQFCSQRNWIIILWFWLNKNWVVIKHQFVISISLKTINYNWNVSIDDFQHELVNGLVRPSVFKTIDFNIFVIAIYYLTSNDNRRFPIFLDEVICWMSWFCSILLYF